MAVLNVFRSYGKRLIHHKMLISFIIFLCVWLCIFYFIIFDDQPAHVSRHTRIHPYFIPNDMCQKTKGEILGVLLITSFTGHTELRAAHRAGIPQSELDDMGFLRVFLIGQVPGKNHSAIQQEMEAEQRQHGDLLQGYFKDDYRNNNYKTYMGFAWACSACRRAVYVVKLDDAVVFDVFQLSDYLQSLHVNHPLVEKSSEFLAGMKFPNSSAQREEDNKFYVTHGEYNGTVYPDYVSSSMYVATLPTVRRLLEEAGKKPKFWIGDIWITGILRENLKIPITELNNWFLNDSQYFECCLRDIMKQNYECGYYVGPLDGKTNLLVDFFRYVRICYYDTCEKRPKGESLLETCKLSSVKDFE